MSDPEGKWLINENDVETVVSLSKKFERPKDYVQIRIDAEDYYRIKDGDNNRIDKGCK